MDHIDYVKKIHMWGTAAPMFIVFVIITLVKGGSAGNYSGASPAYSLSYLMLALLAVFLCIRGLASLVFYLAKKDGSKHAMLSLINMLPVCAVSAPGRGYLLIESLLSVNMIYVLYMGRPERK